MSNDIFVKERDNLLSQIFYIVEPPLLVSITGREPKFMIRDDFPWSRGTSSPTKIPT